MLASDDVPAGERLGPDRPDYPYLLSFENDRNFLVRQSAALALVAIAGFIEFPQQHPVDGRWHLLLPAMLLIAAIFIMCTALRRYQVVDKAIRATCHLRSQ